MIIREMKFAKQCKKLNKLFEMSTQLALNHTEEG